MNKKKVLFITEKYCDGDPNKGITNSYHNLFGSFSHTYTVAAEYDYSVLHFDEIYLKGKHIDNFAQQIYEKTKPDIVFCTLLGTEPSNPSEAFFDIFKKNGSKIAFIWPDFGRDWTIRSCQRFDKYIDLNIAIACEKNGNFPKTLWTWTPEDPSYFYSPQSDSEKDIDVLFLGTTHSRERAETLEFLKQRIPNNVKTYFGGGQRQEKLSHEKYAELTRRAKIVINFPYSVAGNDQLKGRVFEATACGSLLLERTNLRTREFFDPNSEYVEYSSKEDLVEKIAHYLKNPEERIKIAEAGRVKNLQNWSHNCFWNLVMKEINK